MVDVEGNANDGISALAETTVADPPDADNRGLVSETENKVEADNVINDDLGNEANKVEENIRDQTLNINDENNLRDETETIMEEVGNNGLRNEEDPIEETNGNPIVDENGEKIDEDLMVEEEGTETAEEDEKEQNDDNGDAQEEKKNEAVREEKKNKAVREEKKNEDAIAVTEKNGGGTENRAAETVNDEENVEKKVDENTNQKVRKVRKRNKKKKVTQGAANNVISEDKDKPESSKKKKASKKVESMGMIFMCTSKTKKDCYQYNVLGLPAGKKDLVEKIYKGMRLFLFDLDLRLMYGIYKAAGPGGTNIEPKAFGSAFPSQVRFTVLEDCLPLAEEKFKTTIKENYYTGNKFNCQLNSEQVKNLCKLFISAGKAPNLQKPGESLAEENTSEAQDRSVRQRGRDAKQGRKRKGRDEEKKAPNLQNPGKSVAVGNTSEAQDRSVRQGGRDVKQARKRKGRDEEKKAPNLQKPGKSLAVGNTSEAQDRSVRQGGRDVKQGRKRKGRDEERGHKQRGKNEERGRKRKARVEGRSSPFRQERGNHKRPLVYTNEALPSQVAPRHGGHQLPPPVPVPLYAYERTLEMNPFRREPVTEHRGLRLVELEPRHHEDTRNLDSYITYREREAPSYRIPTYSMASQREYYPPSVLPAAYRPVVREVDRRREYYQSETLPGEYLPVRREAEYLPSRREAEYLPSRREAEYLPSQREVEYRSTGDLQTGYHSSAALPSDYRASRSLLAEYRAAGLPTEDLAPAGLSNGYRRAVPATEYRSSTSVLHDYRSQPSVRRY